MTRLFSSLLICQIFAGFATADDPFELIQKSVAAASEAIEYDAAALILSDAMTTPESFRHALDSRMSDERNLYIVFGLHWGSKVEITGDARIMRRSVRAKMIAEKPTAIQKALRAERYECYLYSHARYGHGAATINYFPYFSRSKYADDLAEIFIEALRTEVSTPKRAVVHPHSPGLVMISEEERELGLLELWQHTCGLTGQLDLIEDTTEEAWRLRFQILDQRFKTIRPFVVWNDETSSMQIDAENKKSGRPTRREQRVIPELRPTWDFKSQLD